MVGWHHRFSGREYEQALGDGEGQGNLACCSPWGCKELDILSSNLNCQNLGNSSVKPILTSGSIKYFTILRH